MKKTKLLMLALISVLAVTVFASCDFLLGKCDHNFENGWCTDCGQADPDYTAPCVHEYVGGNCSKCGEADPSYKAPCAQHQYSNGTCTACGTVCAHTAYTDGKCAECKTDCKHTFVNGVCSVCNMPCKHNFEDGICSVCNTPCTHDYENGVCTDCGAKDPDCVPSDGGVSLYAPIVEKYKYLVTYKREFEELPPKGSSEPEYVDALYEMLAYYDPTMEMGYAYKDINSDGYKELVLIQSDAHIHAIFNIVDGAVQPLFVFQNGMGYTAPDGMIFYNLNYINDDGHQISSRHMTYMEKGKLVGIEYGWVDTDGDIETNEDTVYYTVGADGVRVVLTKDEYNLLSDKYAYNWDYPSRLTRLTGYVFNPVLITAVTNRKEADFSTYDTIIKTFGIMHSEVAGGKYEKTYWTSGKYDAAMIFKSEEDFYIYNKLIAACVLIRNNKDDTFGFAKKDLNGDGKEELILLEGTQFNVLAIFTEKDGKAVLLDTYSDLRQAFIDASGNIHVKQTVIPGYKQKDALYTVYEIKNGELSAKLSIGEEYRKKGSYSSEAYKWYKLEGGVRVDLTQDEWNTLYESYALDIGTTKYNVYTQNNAGLTFTEVPLAAEN